MPLDGAEMERTLKKDVWIHIKGLLRDDEDEEDKTELYTQGSYYKKNGSYYITYEESETTGFAGCRTVLKVDGGNKVSLVRHGDSRSHLMIERGERNVGYYNTGVGELMIGVSAHEIDVKLDDRGGQLYFSYSLDVNSTHISDNEVFISVKEMN